MSTVMVMDMGSYEIQRDFAKPEHGENAVPAEWNLAVALSPRQPEAPVGTSMPADLATTDVELFLRRMSAQR